MAKGTSVAPTTAVASVPTAAAKPVVSHAAAVVEPMLHCPYRQAALLQQALSSDKMRVGFFLGAGCPLSVRVMRGVKNEALIPDIVGLTDKIRASMAVSVACKGHFEAILKQLGDSTTSKSTVEHVLTRVRGLIEVVGAGRFEGMCSADLQQLNNSTQIRK